MLGRLKTTTLFFIPFLLLLVMGLFYFLYNEQGDFVLWMNGLHHPNLNYFFKYWTYTGDWFFVVVVTLVVLFFNLRYGLILALVGATQGLLTAFLKQVVFPDSIRPKGYFEGKQVLDLIEGVKVQDFNSFPSGHTMTAFAMVTFLALMIRNNRYSLLLLIGATLTALSRVYLGQHFLIDIIAGSLIGVIVATSLFMAFERYLDGDRSQKVEDSDDLSKMDINVEDVN